MRIDKNKYEYELRSVLYIWDFVYVATGLSDRTDTA